MLLRCLLMLDTVRPELHRPDEASFFLVIKNYSHVDFRRELSFWLNALYCDPVNIYFFQ